MRETHPHRFLTQSAHKGDLAEIERVVSNNINPNVSDYDGRTCLHIAAAEGRCDILKYLLSCQANVNVSKDNAFLVSQQNLPTGN